MKSIDCEVQKRTLQAAVNDCAITIAFEADPPETSIWHYVFDALCQQRDEPVQSGNIPLE